MLTCLKRSRTREAPTPTNISTNSDALMDRKLTPASPATALASKVLPVPGGPHSSTPLGMRAPDFLNRWGFKKKSTTSISSFCTNQEYLLEYECTVSACTAGAECIQVNCMGICANDAQMMQRTIRAAHAVFISENTLKGAVSPVTLCTQCIAGNTHTQ